MEQFSSWRELLGRLIHNPSEKQHIANELGVGVITLGRWVNNTSNPRPVNLRRLLDALPQQRTQLLELLPKEFPGFMEVGEEQPGNFTEDIPSTFYARVLNAYATTPKTQRFWSISNLILQQALGQLDPNHVGMAITIVQCMPPSVDNKILSLRERVGRGTPPWSMNLEQQAIFLGEESLAGNVVTHCRYRIIQNREEGRGIFPAHWVEWEQSAAAYPIMRAGEIAGCLLISCTQPDYFLPFRHTLMQYYAELVALVFESEEFYPPNQLSLRLMPFYRTQETHLASFRQRVSDIMVHATRNRQPMNLVQAQQLVWKQLEEELLQLPPYIQE